MVSRPFALPPMAHTSSRLATMVGGFRGASSMRDRDQSAIADAVMAPILGPDGQALAAHGWHDTESIADDGGTLYVGIETVNQIVQFDYGKDGLLARGHPIPVPPGIRTLPRNKGLEALVFVPRNQPMGGTLIAISERGLDRSGKPTRLSDWRPSSRHVCH